jgi:RHS repeat-associated protein
MNIGAEYAVGYGYDNVGRFSTVTNGADTFTYGYLPNSNLVSSIQYPASISVTKSYEANRDLVTAIENKYGNTTISRYDYSNDDLGRRTAMGKSGTAFTQADTIAYGYNDKSEVTSAVSANIATQNWGYAFDGIGNRMTSSSTETGSAVTRTYTSNQLNQYTAIDAPATNPTYDFDGNMLNDGTWAFTWNGENRIITATQGASVIDYKYDYFGRRIERKVTEGGTITSQTRYVYENASFNKIEELNALDSNAIAKKYIWGLDIAGDLYSAGGVGALLSENNSYGAFYAIYDGNGNVSEYQDNTGATQAHYEYSPSGIISHQNGAMMDSFVIRYSTKSRDNLTGDDDYGLRDYSSGLGRWKSRDRIGEKGGKNVYAMCSNNPINKIDRLGMLWGYEKVKECVKLLKEGGDVNPDPPHPLKECPKTEGSFRHCMSNCKIKNCIDYLKYIPFYGNQLSQYTTGGLVVVGLVIEVPPKEDSLNDIMSNIAGIAIASSGLDCPSTCVAVSDALSDKYCCKNPTGLNKDNPSCCDNKCPAK